MVDVANVMGSRPDGWWRDRAGAATRLLASLAPLAGSSVSLPNGDDVSVARVVAVTEGKARSAVTPEGLDVVAAPADGDSSIAAAAVDVVADGGVPVVATADRGLRARLPDGAISVGPGWLLALL